jgi:A/G-specific adenine glycosylase
VTNYYVTVYGFDAGEIQALGGVARDRRWFSPAELLEIPLTGLARKVLKRLKALPGYTAPGTALKLDAAIPGASR